MTHESTKSKKSYEAQQRLTSRFPHRSTSSDAQSEECGKTSFFRIVTHVAAPISWVLSYWEHAIQDMRIVSFSKSKRANSWV